MASRARDHDLTGYRGKNLALLVVALCLPAALLYLRLLFGILATSNRVTVAQADRLNALANAALVLFFIAQVISAWYQERRLRPRKTLLGRVLQYLAVFLMGILFSLMGAILLESFGFAVFLRSAKLQ